MFGFSLYDFIPCCLNCKFASKKDTLRCKKKKISVSNCEYCDKYKEKAHKGGVS